MASLPLDLINVGLGRCAEWNAEVAKKLPQKKPCKPKAAATYRDKSIGGKSKKYPGKRLTLCPSNELPTGAILEALDS